MWKIQTTFVLAALSVLQNASASPLEAREFPSGLTCDKNDRQTFISDRGILYQLFCNTDYRNGDLASVPGSSHIDCVNACDTTKDCITAVYDGQGTCYLKKQLFEATDDDRTTTVKRVFIPRLCQPSQGNSIPFPSRTGFFEIYCGTDYIGGDLPNGAVPADRLEECIKTCSSTTGCVGTTFHHGTCFLKEKLDRVQSAVEASSAVRILDCDGKRSDGTNYPMTSGKSYTLVCGKNYKGTEFQTTIGTFEDCIQACDKSDKCVNTSWKFGICKLKSSLGSVADDSRTWTALRNQEV